MPEPAYSSREGEASPESEVPFDRNLPLGLPDPTSICQTASADAGAVEIIHFPVEAGHLNPSPRGLHAGPRRRGHSKGASYLCMWPVIRVVGHEQMQGLLIFLDLREAPYAAVKAVVRPVVIH